MLVLIPKPEPGQVHGISLLEPIWKLISVIIHIQLMKHITFHVDFHSFLLEHGTGTACLEAKLAVQLAYHTGRPLYHIYLDFSKAYDLLESTRTLILLHNYGVGPNTICLIALFWDQHTVIPRQQQFFSIPFHAERGLATGDILAPLFYNIVMDAVI